MVNLIGISPEYGTADYYLSQLPNVNIRTADSAVGDDYISGKAMLEDMISTAEKIILEDARVQFSPTMTVKSVISNDIAGLYKVNAESISSEAGKYKGIQIRMKDRGFFDIYLDSVEILSESAIATTLKVYNLITGEELHTQAVTLAVGTNEVDLSLKVKTQNQKVYLAVVTDATYDTQDTDVYSGGCTGCRSKTYGNEYLSFYGTEVATGDTKIYANFSNLSHTNGISLRYSLQCSIEAFVYKYRNLFAQVIWYKAAEMLMESVVYNTQRVNTIVTIHSATAEDLMRVYGAKYAERMKWVLQTIQPPANDVCFACNYRVKYKTVI